MAWMLLFMLSISPVMAAERTPLLPLEAFFGNPRRPNPPLEGLPLAPTRRVRLKAGARARLTLPLNTEPKGLPSVLDLSGEERTAQWLANRGYAVLQVEPKHLADGLRWLVRKGIADPKRIGVFGVRESAGDVAIAIELPDEKAEDRLQQYGQADRLLAERLGGRAGPEAWE